MWQNTRKCRCTKPDVQSGKNVADFKIWAVNNLFIPNTLGVVKSGKLSGTTCGNDVSSKHGSYVAEICY